MRKLSAALAGLALCAGCVSRSSHTGAASSHARPAPDAPTRSPVTVAELGRSRFVLFAPERLLPAPSKRPPREPPDQKRLRASLDDFVDYFQQLSGATLEVHYGAPSVEQAKGRVILLGELGAARFGRVAEHLAGDQAFRVVVEPNAIGLFGESDLATSYALYELLDRWGCRWFMPGALGEELPARAERLSLREGDSALRPSTVYRNLWYADEAFKRRNRLGGPVVEAGHRLEAWITAAQREENPSWRAVISGTPHATRLRWSNPEVAGAIADAIDAWLASHPSGSVSLSPGDGVDFDESLDRSVDAGDWDATTNSVSLTDRLLVLANRVAERVAPSHPDLTFGLLAYVSYSRPPVREQIHPSIVPVIAPITYCRQHALSDETCPGAVELRQNIVGWSQRASRLAFRSYAYNLAEPSAPFPLLRKWSFDLPFMFSHNVAFFQPETLPNFDTSLPGLWLGIRLAWDTSRAPEAITDELFRRFYGHAAAQARAYIELMDGAWADVAEFSGGDFGYEERFSPERLAHARALLNAAKAACENDRERARIELLDASLGQLELYMHLLQSLRLGELSTIGADTQRWLENARTLAGRYAANSAFGGARWAGPTGAYGAYFKRFHETTYVEAARVAAQEELLTPRPLCDFQQHFDPELALPTMAETTLGPSGPHTDVCRKTWSSLGRHDYFGGVWYQTQLPALAVARTKKARLWLTRVDGTTQAWLNGQALHRVEAPTPEARSAEAHAKSLLFDITGSLRADAPNRLTIACRRGQLTELGVGGLVGPVYAYAER